MKVRKDGILEIVTITGSTAVVNTVTITGSTSVVNIVSVTGSTEVVNTITITGSTSVVNTVTITGSTAVVSIPAITGSVAVVSSVLPTGAAVATSQQTDALTDTELRASPVAITGSTAVVNTVTVTGSTAVVSIPSITGSVAVVSSVLPTGAAVATSQQTDALTDTELRASPVAITGSTSVVNLVSVTGTTLSVQPTPANLKAQVEGTTAAGAAPPNPVAIGGQNVAGNLQPYTAYLTTGALGIYVMPSLLVGQNVDTGAEVVQVVNKALYIGGDEDHDDTDAGYPIKIGGKAIDYHPDTDAEQGAAEVAANDRANAAINLRGQIIEGVNGRYNVLDNVNTTYDDSPTGATSTAIECWNYRWATLSFSVVSVSAPTDIIFEVEQSPDGTNFFKMTEGPLGAWVYDDVSCATAISESFTFPISCQKIRVNVLASGTTASKIFTVTNATLFLRN